MRAPIPRIGGKGRLAPKIVPYFRGASLYLEPFFGTGSVFFALPSVMYAQCVVNDVDKWVYSFFKVLRERPDDLVRACELTPYAYDEYRAAAEFLKSGAPSADELELARVFFVLTHQSFAAKATGAGGWARSADGHCANTGVRSVERFKQIAEALRDTCIDNLDAVAFVRSWCRRPTETFIYCDPPYVRSTRDTNRLYLHEMTDAQHRELAAELLRCANAGAHVAVSGYNGTLYDELFSGWEKVEFPVTTCVNAGVGGSGGARTEVLWMSYKKPTMLVPGSRLYTQLTKGLR